MTALCEALTLLADLEQMAVLKQSVYFIILLFSLSRSDAAEQSLTFRSSHTSVSSRKRSLLVSTHGVEIRAFYPG